MMVLDSNAVEAADGEVAHDHHGDTGLEELRRTPRVGHVDVPWGPGRARNWCRSTSDRMLPGTTVPSRRNVCVPSEVLWAKRLINGVEVVEGAADPLDEQEDECDRQERRTRRARAGWSGAAWAAGRPGLPRGPRTTAGWAGSASVVAVPVTTARRRRRRASRSSRRIRRPECPLPASAPEHQADGVEEGAAESPPRSRRRRSSRRHRLLAPCRAASSLQRSASDTSSSWSPTASSSTSIRYRTPATTRRPTRTQRS